MNSPQLIVGICTDRDESLDKAISSVVKQSLQPDALIIADSDVHPSAEQLVLARAEHSLFPIYYMHVPARNIAIARNACLEAAQNHRLAFMDVRATAEVDWLEMLVLKMSGDVSAVFGPSLAVYPKSAPRWMRRAALHTRRLPQTGGLIKEGHTANCLLDLRHPAFFGRMFSEKRARNKANESRFFHNAFCAGAKFELTNEAVIRCSIRKEELSLQWLMEQKISDSRARAVITSENNRFRTLKGAFRRALGHAFCTLFWCPKGKNRSYHYLMLGQQWGTILGALDTKFYQEPPK